MGCYCNLALPVRGNSMNTYERLRDKARKRQHQHHATRVAAAVAAIVLAVSAAVLFTLYALHLRPALGLATGALLPLALALLAAAAVLTVLYRLLPRDVEATLLKRYAEALSDSRELADFAMYAPEPLAASHYASIADQSVYASLAMGARNAQVRTMAARLLTDPALRLDVALRAPWDDVAAIAMDGMSPEALGLIADTADRWERRVSAASRLGDSERILREIDNTLNRYVLEGILAHLTQQEDLARAAVMLSRSDLFFATVQRLDMARLTEPTAATLAARLYGIMTDTSADRDAYLTAAALLKSLYVSCEPVRALLESYRGTRYGKPYRHIVPGSHSEGHTDFHSDNTCVCGDDMHCDDSYDTCDWETVEEELIFLP